MWFSRNDASSRFMWLVGEYERHADLQPPPATIAKQVDAEVGLTLRRLLVMVMTLFLATIGDIGTVESQRAERPKGSVPPTQFDPGRLPNVDAFGDTLPSGARLRLGT